MFTTSTALGSPYAASARQVATAAAVLPTPVTRSGIPAGHSAPRAASRRSPERAYRLLGDDSGAGVRAVSLDPMPEFIYVFSRARKAHGEKVILDDVTLSFLPAPDRRRRPQWRRQVHGPGRSWSALSRRPTGGAADPGYSVGILMQEPQLDETKTVLGNVEEGAGDIKRALDRYNEISERWPTRTPTSMR